MQVYNSNSKDVKKLLKRYSVVRYISHNTQAKQNHYAEQIYNCCLYQPSEKTYIVSGAALNSTHSTEMTFLKLCFFFTVPVYLSY